MLGLDSLQDALPLLALAAAYLLGSIPFGIWIARSYRVGDLTSRGSGNIGATNVSRVVGFWPAGFLTLLLDLSKGLIPVLLISPWGASIWTSTFFPGGYSFAETVVWSAGLFAVLGHCFSPWLKLRGGKGVATGLGALLILSPLAALTGIVVFVMTFLIRRIGSLASIAGLVAACTAHLVLYPVSRHLWAGAAMVFLILNRHESNLEALLEGREKVF